MSTLAAIRGRVTGGGDDQPLVGARVYVKGQLQATTDESGEFMVTGLTPADGAAVVFEHPGHAEGVKVLALVGGDQTEVEVKLMPGAVRVLNMAAGGTVSDGSGGEATFPPNAFVRRNGAPVSGDVSVTLVALDPAADDGLEIFPGTFAAVSADGTRELLETFVPMNITARVGDEVVDLAPGKKVRLRFPVPAPLVNDAPDTMPLWSLDPETGRWKEEPGLAILQADASSPTGFSYVGDAGHMSWWNCDRRQETTCIKGCVRTRSGAIAANKQVTGRSSSLSLPAAFTNRQGCFAMDVPRSRGITLEVKPAPNEVAVRSITSQGRITRTWEDPSWASCQDIGTLQPTGGCTPGARECFGRELRVCNSFATWVRLRTCEYGCGNAQCLSCTPGGLGCQGNQPVRCDARGQWVSTGATCSATCLRGQCTACRPQDRRCQGNQPQICSAAGQWVSEGGACSTGVCVARPLANGSRCSGTCTPGQNLGCEAGAPKVCNALGQPTVGRPCANACVNGQCVECQPGARGCSPTREPMTCSAEGGWTRTGPACPMACDQGACVQCTPGSRRCLDRVGQLCSSAGTWETERTCAYLCAMEGTGTRCGGECRPGARGCQSINPVLCDQQGRWEQQPACPFGCREGACISCSPFERRCDGNQVQTRDAQCNWTSVGACAGECQDGQCVPCQEGTSRCHPYTAKSVLVCRGGAYVEEMTCALGCSAGGCMVCRAGQRRCVAEGEQLCDDDGRWQPASPCPYGCEGDTCRVSPASPDGGVGGGPADGRPPGDAGCNDLSLAKSPTVTARSLPGPGPAPRGGSAVNGVYDLVSFTFYDQPVPSLIAGVPIRSMLEIADSLVNGRESFGPAEATVTAQYSVEGTSLVIRKSCPDSQVHNWTFTATDGGLILFNTYVPGAVAEFRHRGAAAVTPDAGPGPGDTGCNDLSLADSPAVRPQSTDRDPPPPRGGGIADDTYDLVGITLYNQPAVPPEVSGRAVVRIAGDFIDSRSQVTGSPESSATDRYMVQGTSLVLMRSCPEARTQIMPFTTTDLSLFVYDAHGTGSVAEYRRRGGGTMVDPTPTPDAGPPAGTYTLTVTPTDKDFGAVYVGAVSATQLFQVRNDSPTSAAVRLGLAGGTDPGAFVIVQSECGSAALEPYATCAVGVRFAPRSEGPQSAIYEVSADGFPPLRVHVQGIGLPSSPDSMDPAGQ